MGMIRGKYWLTIVSLALALLPLSGCGRDKSSATVEGTLRLNGKPLENCLVTFLPESGQEESGPHSTGYTDQQGVYRLRFADQQEGVVVGRHRVTIQDLSVAMGVVRRDHGTVDAEVEESGIAAPVRPSRVSDGYASASRTPLTREVKLGHQVIDLDLQ